MTALATKARIPWALLILALVLLITMVALSLGQEELFDTVFYGLLFMSLAVTGPSSPRANRRIQSAGSSAGSACGADSWRRGRRLPTTTFPPPSRSHRPLGFDAMQAHR